MQEQRGARQRADQKNRTAIAALREFFAEKPITPENLIGAFEHLRSIESLGINNDSVRTMMFGAYREALEAPTKSEMTPTSLGERDEFNSPAR